MNKATIDFLSGLPLENVATPVRWSEGRICLRIILTDGSTYNRKRNSWRDQKGHVGIKQVLKNGDTLSYPFPFYYQDYHCKRALFYTAIVFSYHQTWKWIVKTKALARSCVWWPSMENITSMTENCQMCQFSIKNPKKGATLCWEPASHPMERLHIDYMGP